MPRAKSDTQFRREVESALYVLAREQMNQSGRRADLMAVLERFAADGALETRPAQAFEMREAVTA